MKQLRNRVGGLDVHRDSVVASVRIAEPQQPVEVNKQQFGTTTAELKRLADWLSDYGVTTVIMEATGVYWRPVFYSLEGLFDEVQLANAQHVKNVPGRKTDLADSEWLADVAAHGMVRPSLIPEPEVRGLRELTRYRKTQIEARGKEIQRLEKILQDAGVKITSFTSKVLSVSSRQMIEALINGERDPAVLANLAKASMRQKIDKLQRALDVPHWKDHHAVVARRILAHIDFLDETIDELTKEVLARLGPFDRHVELLSTIPHWGNRTIEVFLSETGGDMSKFPTAGHLAAWAGVAPASHESAGKRKAAGTRHGANWLRVGLVEAAHCAGRSGKTYFSARYRRIAKRRGSNKAAVAVAHSMVIAAWHVLTNNEPYKDLGADYYEKKQDPEAQKRRHVKKLESLGYEVTIKPAA